VPKVSDLYSPFLTMQGSPSVFKARPKAAAIRADTFMGDK
jgi:hypothetical protein